MIEEVLATIVICLGFAVGALSYKNLENLVDVIKEKFQHKLLTRAKNVALGPIAVLGAFFAATTETRYFLVASFIMIIFSLLFGIFVIAEKDKKLTQKYIAETIIVFAVFFATIYALFNYIFV